MIWSCQPIQKQYRGREEFKMTTTVKRVVPALGAIATMMAMTMPASAQGQYGYNQSHNDSNGYSGANYNAAPPNYQRGRVSYIPAGMVIPVTLSTAVSTNVARPGDMVQATLSQNVNLGDSIIPAGSIVTGRVTDAKAGGFLGRAGMLTFKFNSLRTPNGMEVPMSAHIVGGLGKYAEVGSQSDTFAGETWKNKAGQTAMRGVIGAGAGAALGTAIGAIASHGHGYTGRGIGRGAWSGAAIGGGVGVADGLLLRKGKQVNISSGLPLQLQLDAPMSVSSNTQTGAF